MRVIGRDKLHKFSKKHNQAKPAQDIKNRYNAADFLADNRVIFNIKGNHYRLVIKVRYQNEIVVIEWVGTHAEYDKKRF